MNNEVKMYESLKTIQVGNLKSGIMVIKIGEIVKSTKETEKSLYIEKDGITKCIPKSFFKTN